MRKWMKAILAAACIAALLASCGTKAPETPQQPEEEPASETPEPVVTVPTLAELRTANDPVEILKGHQTVSITMEARDGSGNLTASGEILYRRDTAGAL